MREIAFIKQNKEKWIEFEQIISGKLKKTPDELANLYIHITNDLSYVQTFYPKTKLEKYLNYLAAQMYLRVYKTKRYETNRLIHFFKFEVPLLAFQYKKFIHLAFLVFFLFVFFGAISARYDDSFVRLILGDDYVNMTLENIEKGDAMAVYKSSSNWASSFAITINNLYVGLRCYLYGIFGGFGTLYILLQNCIMLGSFQYFFYEKNVFMESIRGVWLHGAMEIFAIVIESACGFILGASILFPKTYSRLESFKIGFLHSFKLFISTIPFTLMAGFIEGYITRYAKQMPDFLNYSIILITLFAISYYYLIYPTKIFKKHFTN